MSCGTDVNAADGPKLLLYAAPSLAVHLVAVLPHDFDRQSAVEVLPQYLRTLPAM